MNKTKLSGYSNAPYSPGGSLLKKVLWYYVNVFFFKSAWLPVSAFKASLLRLFGAKIGRKITIKPCVNIKYPWLLTIGDDTWIGENVWIDNLGPVAIGSNCCVSQGAALITGSHNYKKTSFDLIVGKIVLEDGAWIGAGAIVNQGVTVASHAVLTSGSIATKNMEAYTVYQGNPAVKVRTRTID